MQWISRDFGRDGRNPQRKAELKGSPWILFMRQCPAADSWRPLGMRVVGLRYRYGYPSIELVIKRSTICDEPVLSYPAVSYQKESDDVYPRSTPRMNAV